MCETTSKNNIMGGNRGLTKRSEAKRDPAGAGVRHAGELTAKEAWLMCETTIKNMGCQVINVGKWVRGSRACMARVQGTGNKPLLYWRESLDTILLRAH